MESEDATLETRGLLEDDDDIVDTNVHSLRVTDIAKIAQAQTFLQRARGAFANQTYKLTAYAFLVYFLTEFGLLTLQVPGSRLFEHAICRQYYADNPNLGPTSGISKEIDESLCKIAPVQREVALLSGWRDSFLAIPSILTAVVYGSLADKYGRKPILLLAGLGELLVLAWILVICYFDSIFPTRLAWASAVFIFIGGGQRVVVAMLFTMISDHVGISYRTRYMYIINTGPHISGLVAPLIETATMSVNVWLPFFVGIGAYILMLLVVLAMPDTKPTLHTTQIEDVDLEVESTNVVGSPNQISFPLMGPVASLLKVPNLIICFILFLVKRTAFMSENLFYQNASVKYNLQLRQTPWFRSVKAVGSITVLTIVLPTITTLLQRLQYESQKTDLNIMRGSLFTMVIAFLVIYAASSPWVFASAILLCGFGEGIDPGIQGLASTFASSDHRATMFAILAMVDAAGKIIGGPLMAALYSLGMDVQGRSPGYCFIAASGLFASGFAASFMFILHR